MRTRSRATTSRRIRRGGVFAVAASAALVLLGAAPAPPETAAPAAGRFLVATEAIRGSIFRQSVVYLLRYDGSGAVGLIVNRPTDVRLREVLADAADAAGTLHLGGPVERGTVMMLLRADEAPGRAGRVADDVFVSSHPDLLQERARSGEAARFRVYAGHAGWGPRQLEGEIARGQWLVVEAPSSAIFDETPGGLWKQLFRRHHKLVAGIRSRSPARPRI